MNEFLDALYTFILRVEQMPRFKGKAQAVKSLKRITQLSVFR